MDTYDVLIAGGGIAGLVATASFAKAGYRVLCCDINPRKPRTKDLRSTAFLMPSIALLESIDVWSALQPYSAELVVMRLADAGGPDNSVRYTADFDARDLGQSRFGSNVPNWRLREALIAHIDALPRAELSFETGVDSYLSREAYGLARLSTGQTARTKLLLAADGRDSTLREAANIPAKRTRYGQKALVFTVTHPLAHNSISTEIHRSGGPFTTVPLPDHNGNPASAIVWMETGDIAAKLFALDEKAFEQEITARSCNILGPLTLTSKRAMWPIISQKARRLVEGRMALIAEAAHVVPPIGAQGLNMSLGDVTCLLDLSQGKADPGAPDLLARYERTRLAEINLKVPGVDLLNRAALAKSQNLRDLRLAGLKALFENRNLRDSAMRAGLGI